MRYESFVPHEAIVEIEEIALYYELDQPGLGQNFKQAIDAAIVELEAFHAHQVRYDDIRLKQIRRFPHLIHYRVDELHHLIVVLTVLHPRRDSLVG